MLASSSRHRVHAEHQVLIDPYLFRFESRGPTHRSKLVDRVLAGILGMDGFARAKLEGLAVDVDRLLAQALEMNFDASLGLIIENLVADCSSTKSPRTAAILSHGKRPTKVAVAPCNADSEMSIGT
jgi:hypothetical protein